MLFQITLHFSEQRRWSSLSLIDGRAWISHIYNILMAYTPVDLVYVLKPVEELYTNDTQDFCISILPLKFGNHKVLKLSSFVLNANPISSGISTQRITPSTGSRLKHLRMGTVSHHHSSKFYISWIGQDLNLWCYPNGNSFTDCLLQPLAYQSKFVFQVVSPPQDYLHSLFKHSV